MEITTVQGAAEVAAEYIFHLFDELGGSYEDGVKHACEVYKLITGKDDAEEVLGF